MNWFWLNIRSGAVPFLAMAAIPPWMVIRHPDDRPASAGATGVGARARAAIVTVAGMTGRPLVPAQICGRRERAGASAGVRG
jgi:hypothetical protein